MILLVRAIMCSCYHELIHVSYLCGEPIYYSCNGTFKNVLTLIYPIAKTLNIGRKQISSSCDSPLNLLFSFTSHVYNITQHNQSAVTIRLETELLTQSVNLFRVRHASDCQKTEENYQSLVSVDTIQCHDIVH